MDRRTFLKLAGVGGLSFAASCTSQPAKTLYSLVQAPDDMVPGSASWYASTCRECPAGCGILAKNREGRTIKIEGNPLHPINRGRLCMRGQAALQGVYNPDRIKAPLVKEQGEWRPLSYGDAEALLKLKADKAAQQGRDRVRMISETSGDSLISLMTESLRRWNSAGPLIFEPYGYESLKAANERIFGLHGLPAYRMEQADFLLSFGADFLETWLSPVEYARKFKEMHSVNGDSKALFFHVSPYQSLTGVNADVWLSCNPDTEYTIALGLLREGLRLERGNRLPKDVRNWIQKISAPYTRDKVNELSGAAPELLHRLARQLESAKRPLILGTSTGALGSHTLQTNVAVNLLNLVCDPDLSLFDFVGRHRVEKAARRSEVLNFLGQLEGASADILLLNNVNPVFSFPAADGLREALQRDSLFVVSFSNFMDETTELADLVLPVGLPLESWDEYSGKIGIVATVQPTMGSLTKAPTLGDVLLRTASGKNRPYKNFQAYVFAQLVLGGVIREEKEWLETLQKGGIFDLATHEPSASPVTSVEEDQTVFTPTPASREQEIVFIAVPSIRFFDGRGANKPWLCEVPDPLTKVAWQTPVLMHPETVRGNGLRQGDVVQVESKWGVLEAPVYETSGVRP
ncbi:MAG: twin-arginine translocation signal domain-containing protein, partial [Deltaproteobacteria bacterium]